MTAYSGNYSSMSNDVIKQIFTQLHQRLVEGMNSTLVIDALFSKNILHTRDAVQLHSIQLPDERCRRLLFLLHASGNPQAFVHLYSVLMEDASSKWLIEEVEKRYKYLTGMGLVEDQQLLGE
jgi:hypothetical protein